MPHTPEAARPLLLRVLPDWLRLSVWARLYRGRHAGRLPLYSAAPLTFASNVRMQLVPGDIISDSIAFTGMYEFLLTKRISDLARRGGTFVEVGANLGYFSLLWAAARDDNRCVAFEASPRNIEMLRENVRRNGLADRIRVIPFAAGAERGTVAFDPGPPDQTGWGGFSTTDTQDAITVEVVRVDEMVDAAEPIAVLKIDTEGSDTWVLMGCDRLLKARTIREVWYEQNKPRANALGIPPDAAKQYLASVGYGAYPGSDPDAEIVEWCAAPFA